MSPNYTSLIDDATELADRLMHARDETIGSDSEESTPLSIAAADAIAIVNYLKRAQAASTREHIDEILARANQGTATATDIQRIRKALENFYD